MSWAALFDGIFPVDIAVRWGEIGDAVSDLLPEEAALMTRAVAKRQREFARGRVCAREALASLGAPGHGLLVGPEREPLWPAGIVGSITHDNTLCVVAVARGERYAGLGVDVEPEEPLESNVAARIWSPVEAEHARTRAGIELAVASRLAFSAKEAFYKCQFPLTRVFLGFNDVRLELGDERFEVILEVDAGQLERGTRFAGVWRRAGGKLFTAMVLSQR